MIPDYALPFPKMVACANEMFAVGTKLRRGSKVATRSAPSRKSPYRQNKNSDEPSLLAVVAL